MALAPGSKKEADFSFRRGLAELQAGNLAAAIASLSKSIAIEPRNAASLSLLGALMHRSARYEEAESLLNRALREQPRSEVTLYNLGLTLKALGRPAEAATRFGEALRINPNVAETWNNRGSALNDGGKFKEAASDFDRAIELKPDYAEAYCNKGNSLVELRRFDEASVAYEAALRLNPQLAPAWVGRGQISLAKRAYSQALDAFEAASRIDRNYHPAWRGAATALIALGRLDDAEVAANQAIALAPGNSLGWVVKGILLLKLPRIDAAIETFRAAIKLEPSNARAWCGLADALRLSSELGREQKHDEALSAYSKAIELDSTLALAHYGRGSLFADLRRYEDALANYDVALGLQEDLEYLHGVRVYAKQQICDWTNLDQEIEALVAAVRSGNLATPPLAMLSVDSTPGDQRACAERAAKEQAAFPPLWRGEVHAHDRLRVAYLSSDFRGHPVGTHIAGLLEAHDRSRVEITAISTGPADGSSQRERIETACERFIDAADKDDAAIAGLIHEKQIEVLIDLNGLTAGSKPGVLARRPAPVQACYLGYAGTSGMREIDYLLADRIAIPQNDFAHFTEKIVWLPGCFFPAVRSSVENNATREGSGLPEEGVIFCCFNTAYKITPSVFAVWMRLLHDIAGSVLWLSDTNPAAKSNLRAGAKRLGIDPERIIFADRVSSLSNHYARLGLADVFVDTLPYGAHSTAADALWSGVPVATCTGSTFAGRVATSMLHAFGMPELIADDLEAYFTVAKSLASDRNRLAALKARIVAARSSSRLFDASRLAANVEMAYAGMRARYLSGEGPAHFSVADDA